MKLCPTELGHPSMFSVRCWMFGVRRSKRSASSRRRLRLATSQKEGGSAQGNQSEAGRLGNRGQFDKEHTVANASCEEVIATGPVRTAGVRCAAAQHIT